MVNFVDTLVSLIIFILVWLLYSCIMIFNIRYVAKKKYKRNEKDYPYFHYPFHKKLFLLGLKGALSPIIVIFTFILNVSVIMLVGFGIWNLVSQNIFASYSYRAVSVVYLISFFLRLIFYLCIPPKFE